MGQKLKSFCEVPDFAKTLITNCWCPALSCRDLCFLSYVVKNTRKTFVWFIILDLYAVIWGEQSKIILAERRENGCLCPLWAVCFLSAEQMPGRPASLLCQSQAIRANGSTCLYVGCVWGLLFSGIGLFLFPGSWKTPGPENTLYSKFGRWSSPGKPIPHPHPCQRLKHFAEVEFELYLFLRAFRMWRDPCAGLGRPLPALTWVRWYWDPVFHLKVPIPKTVGA